MAGIEYTENDNLSTKQAAEYLGVNEWWLVERRANSKPGPVFSKIGTGINGKVIYKFGDLVAFVQSRRVNNTAEGLALPKIQ